MRRLLGLLFVVCVMQLPLFAQGTIPFTINFPVFPGGPSGSAELVGSSFTAQTTPWNFAPDYGRIFEIAGDGSTTPMFQFSSLLAGTYPPSDFPGGGGGTYYYYFETWNLTSSQTENLLAGHWFMEIAFGPSTLLSRITPVPEPTSATLHILGVGMILLVRRGYMAKLCPQSNQRKPTRNANCVAGFLL